MHIYSFVFLQVIITKIKSRSFSSFRFCEVFLCFAGVFIFGAFTLMVFVDVTKLMTGRLRPNFLELCRVNVTACRMNGNHGDDSMCQEKDEMVIKHAR